MPYIKEASEGCAIPAFLCWVTRGMSGCCVGRTDWSPGCKSCLKRWHLERNDNCTRILEHTDSTFYRFFNLNIYTIKRVFSVNPDAHTFNATTDSSKVIWYFY